MSALETALEELYSADPSDFTKTRDALVKRLKAAGDKEGAASLGARRKPTQIAWVLNQLARREPDAIAELVDVGRELAREQRKALRGEKSAGLRDSIDRQRRTIATLAAKTTALMKELGVDPGAHLDEVTSALQAALVDPVVGAELEEGRLEKAPAAAVGFGGPIPDDIAPREPKAEPPPAKKHDAKAATEAAKVAARAAAKEAAAQEAARKAARAEHAKALAAAKHEVKTAASAAKRARHEADEAEKAATAAIERAKRLAGEADEREAAVAIAEKALTKLEANAPD